MTNRPEWCMKANQVSGCYRGYGRCHLDKAIIRNNPKLEDRKRERARISKLAEEDPEAVVRMCLKESLSY